MATVSRDYYHILGLSRTAKADEIKKAYRRLARQVHPDLHSGTKKTEMEKRFKELNEAHEVLSDPEKRKKYDRYGADWEQAEAYEKAHQQAGAGAYGASGGGSPFGTDSFSDLFQNLFGNRANAREMPRGFSAQGEDLETEAELTLREVLTGVTKRIRIREPVACSGCHGRRVIRGRPCPTCTGTGSLLEAKTIEVRIPAGVQDGTKVRVAGKGQLGLSGGKRGDLYLHVNIAPDPVFERHRSDLHVILPLWPWEAALGTEVMAPTLGDPVRVKIPPGSQSDGKLRLKGKGLPTASGAYGDLILILRIVMPARLSDEARRAYEDLKRQHRDDPRAELLATARRG